MIISVFLNNVSNPSSRLRFLQYKELFEEAGCTLRIHDFHDSTLTRYKAELKSIGSSICFVQRKLLQPWETWLLSRQRLVYDFDDALIYKDSSQGSAISRSRVIKFKSIMTSASLVIAGNRFLSDMACEYGGANVVIAPTSVNIDDYPVKKHSDDSAAVVIGWIGSTSTIPYLRTLDPVFQRIASKHPSVRIHVVSDAPYETALKNVTSLTWSLAMEKQHINSFDIGIMPLPDDPWAQGKCGFKIIQYFASGLPVVCSPVGVNRDIVDHNKDGFQAADLEDWYHFLCLLIERPALRTSFGRHARRKAVQSYAHRQTFKTIYTEMSRLL